LLNKPNYENAYQSVADILACQTVEEIKAAVLKFIAVAEEAINEHNGVFVADLYRHLIDVLRAWLEPYMTAPRDSARNFVIIPPENAPIMLLIMSITEGVTSEQAISDLKRFITRCDEFSAPIEDAITPDEIETVLEVAERKYKIISLIASHEPLRILQINNSHIGSNAACAVPANPERAAVILLYHPYVVTAYDPVFNFAHELGHALHLAMTHDFNILPEKFDDFNDALDATPESVDQYPEMFADVVAYALISDDCLIEHCPIVSSIEMFLFSELYLMGIT